MTTNHSRRVEAVAGVLRPLLKAGIMPDGAAALAIQVDPATRELEELRAENARLSIELDGAERGSKIKSKLLTEYSEAVAALQYVMEDENLIPRATSAVRSHIKPIIDRARALGVEDVPCKGK